VAAATRERVLRCLAIRVSPRNIGPPGSRVPGVGAAGTP
jgi:hypothetical protein